MYVYFFFFKQRTAYEMGISDWSSDVCSSDLGAGFDDIPHELVPDDIACAHTWDIAVVEMEVRTADRGRGDTQDRIARIDDFGIGDGFDADLVASLPGYGAHGLLLRYGAVSGFRTRGRKATRCSSPRPFPSAA